MRGLKRSEYAWTIVATLGLTAAAMGSPVATAKIVTIGPPSQTRYTKFIRATTAATFFNASITEPGAVATSPVDGVLFDFGIAGARGGPYRVRILRPLGGSVYVAAGTSNPLFFEPSEASVMRPMPIQKGDAIGLDLEKGLPLAASEPTPTAMTASWAPPLAEEEARAYGSLRTNHEFGFNAQVLPPPKVFSVHPRSIDFRHPRKVTIHGDNLALIKAIYFGKARAELFRYRSIRTLVVVPPRSGSPRKTRVAVETLAGTSQRDAETTFTFTNRPAG